MNYFVIYNGGIAGLISAEYVPVMPGDYSFEPYRSSSHLELAQDIRANNTAIVTIAWEGIEFQAVVTSMSPTSIQLARIG